MPYFTQKKIPPSQHNPLKKAIYSGKQKTLVPQLQFFSRAFRGILYNQIWEDPIIDLAALQLDSTSRVLGISSGGCNALNYLVAQPEKVSMVDIQFDHLQIAKMRFYAAKYLPSYAALFQFFVVGKGKENVEAYYDHIRPHLTPEEQAYWESPLKQLWRRYKRRIDIFQDGFYGASKAALVGRMVFPILGIKRSRVETLLCMTDVEAQKEFFDTELLPRIKKRWRHLFFKIPALCAFLGVHPKQIEILQEETKLTLKELFITRLRQSLTDTPCATNYFAWQVLLSHYNVENQDALPPYLQKTHYDLIHQQAQKDRCDYSYESILTKLEQAAPGDYNRFILLDAQEWMSNDDIAKLWSDIVRVGGSGARVIFRTGTIHSYLDEQVSPETRQRLIYHDALSKQLFVKDRLKVYGGFHCYEIA